MRILDNGTDKRLDNIILYLTMNEAEQLVDDLKSLINSPTNNHYHLGDVEKGPEITVCIYDEKDLRHFNERSRKLITEDE